MQDLSCFGVVRCSTLDRRFPEATGQCHYLESKSWIRPICYLPAGGVHISFFSALLCLRVTTKAYLIYLDDYSTFLYLYGTNCEIAFILACDIRFYLRPLLSYER